MFLTDHALRRIAAATNEVLPDQLWRYDTAAEDAVGDLARLLHKTARAYNATTTYLDSAVPKLTARPELRTAGQREDLSGMLAAIERHHVLADVLLDAYMAWRRHRTISGGDEQHLLLYPGDPAHGVITLSRTSPRFWRATADTEAAKAFGVPYADRIVGLIAETPDGKYEATACSSQAHAESGSPMSYRLPDRDDLTTACRSLLRWWQLRHSAAWRSRTPDQLDPTELDQLAA
ncbi:hypothetical protein [Catellatospora tritici]|uniref:hypothetical protein n=1 Tax=Catellatospora tritici TaxID=2851566 RepID=UPI001C2DA248|nr:hypothetical protein [Catellatospora tritici]MBV1854583.1 hypothetical protein [Catellatospora tritici]